MYTHIRRTIYIYIYIYIHTYICIYIYLPWARDVGTDLRLGELRPREMKNLGELGAASPHFEHIFEFIEYFHVVILCYAIIQFRFDKCLKVGEAAPSSLSLYVYIYIYKCLFYIYNLSLTLFTYTYIYIYICISMYIYIYIYIYIYRGQARGPVRGPARLGSNLGVSPPLPLSYMNITLYFIISYHIISYYIILYYVMLYHVV